MDLYEQLSFLIENALKELHHIEAFELDHLLKVAETIRQQGIDAGEMKLKQEAERLIFAVEKEIEDRGGEDYMEQMRKESLEESIADLSDLPTSIIIERMATVQMNMDNGDRNSIERFIRACDKELKKRGMATSFYILGSDGDIMKKHEAFNKKKASEPMKKVKPIAFPDDLTPNKIINAKTPEGIPNN